VAFTQVGITWPIVPASRFQPSGFFGRFKLSGLSGQLAARHVRLRDPPLAGDALVNQRFAAGGQRGDLGFNAGANLILLRGLLLNLAYGLTLNRN
jgi:hypothetical protein